MPNCFSMLEVKEKMILDIISKKRNIKEVVEILGVSRQSVSIWLKKYKEEGLNGLLPKKPGPKSGETHNRTNEVIEDEVCRLAKEYPFEGPLFLKDKLEELYNININQSTVYRILKRTNTRYYYGYYNSRKKRKLYVLDMPGRELQLDVSFPYGYQRKLCVYTVIDDASRYVYSKIYTNHLEDTTILFLKEVINNCKFTIESFRTDQGREFSRKVTDFLQSKGIEHRKNPPYTPQHNGKVERYHRTMKENCCSYWKFKSPIEELNYNLRLWTYYYNSRKRHYGLGMNGLTPENKLNNFKKENPLIMLI